MAFLCLVPIPYVYILLTIYSFLGLGNQESHSVVRETALLGALFLEGIVGKKMDSGRGV